MCSHQGLPTCCYCYVMWSSVPCAVPLEEPVYTSSKWGRNQDTTLTPRKRSDGSIFSCEHLYANRRGDVHCLKGYPRDLVLPSSINSAFPLACLLARRVGYARQRTVSPVPLPRAGHELLLSRRSRYGGGGPLMLLVPPPEPKKHLVTS